MIEREIIKKKLKEFEILEYIAETLDRPGYSHTTIQKTPLGEKVTIYTSKPGFIVGRKGANIKALTEVLKVKFGFENPQVEVSEIEDPNLNPHAVAKHIVHTFERFGPQRFKFLGYKMLDTIIKAGAVGGEIVISGRGVPSQRSKTWRFSAGHLKKSGDVAENLISKGFAVAHLKSGSVGVKVSILTPDVVLPDTIRIKEIVSSKQEEIVEGEKEEKVKEEIKAKAPEVKEEKTTKKKEVKPSKKEEIKEEVKEEIKEELQKEGMKEKVAEKVAEEVKEESGEEITKEVIKKEEKVPTAAELAKKKVTKKE
jgi:small subunit ribosomal protein S3